jgi:hypothetical protein
MTSENKTHSSDKNTVLEKSQNQSLSKFAVIVVISLINVSANRAAASFIA